MSRVRSDAQRREPAQLPLAELGTDSSPTNTTMTSRIPLFVCLITITATGRASAASNSVVESGDAYVSHESGVQWIIGNARLRIGVAAEVGSDSRLVVIG